MVKASGEDALGLINNINGVEMTEEKKEEKIVGASAPKEEPKAAVPEKAPETKPAEPVATIAPAAAQPAAEVKKEEKAAPKKEKPSNCAGCNKSIKKKRWYYRNGKFYCTYRCWKSTIKKEPKEGEGKEAPK